MELCVVESIVNTKQITSRVNLTRRTTGGKQNNLLSSHSNNQARAMDGDPTELNVVRQRKGPLPSRREIRFFEPQRILSFAAEAD